jgi:D-aminopeptidase
MIWNRSPLAPVALLVAALLPLAPRPAMSQTSPDPVRTADTRTADARTALVPTADDPRPRVRELGIRIGIFEPGPLNAITDVAGVRVGQTTVIEGESIRTGVTAILPHDGDLFRSRVPAALHVGNGFGKLVGSTQLRELGELETPILLTCTLCVWQAADAMVDWLLEKPGMGSVGSINPVVGETNDGGLNDIRSRPIRPEHVWSALESANSGPVAEGSVGAGTGTRAFGWKGGIGTASRVLPATQGGWTVGVLVQSNFGGILTVAGAPVGEALGQYSFRGDVTRTPPEETDQIDGAGSIMIVIATDAPLSDRNLERLAARAMMGLGRTGSFAGNGSGDYILAFSTAEGVRRGTGGGGNSAPQAVAELPNGAMSALFQGVVEATEEAVLNSLFRATTVTGRGGSTAEALPIEATLEVLRRHGVLPPR